MGTNVIFANDTGVGKTSFMVAMAKYKLQTEGRARQNRSCAMIDKLNETRKHPLSKPEQAPFMANFDFEIIIGYKKKFSPYYIDPYYFKLPNKGNVDEKDKKSKTRKTMPVVPSAVLFFQEMDDVYDSSVKKPLAATVKGLYNKRRHWDLDIWIELHRSMALNVAIRDVGSRFLEIQSKKSDKDSAGRTIRTTWIYREFTSWRDVETYLAMPVNNPARKKLYVEKTFVNEGDIFKCYDCENCAEEFIPDENDDFVLLPQKNKVDVQTLPPELATYYEPGEAANLRGE